MRKAIAVSATVGVALLSGCSSSSSSSTKPTPAALASVGSDRDQTFMKSITGQGSKTLPAITVTGKSVTINVSCISTGKVVSSDPTQGGVQVSIGNDTFGSGSCALAGEDGGVSIIGMHQDLTNTLSGPVKVETLPDTKWRIWVSKN